MLCVVLLPSPLLQCALGGNAVTTLVACINPSSAYRGETQRTIGFATRAKAVCNRVRPVIWVRLCTCTLMERFSRASTVLQLLKPVAYSTGFCVQAVVNETCEGNAVALAAEVAKLQRELAAARMVTGRVRSSHIDLLASPVPSAWACWYLAVRLALSSFVSSTGLHGSCTRPELTTLSFHGLRSCGALLQASGGQLGPARAGLRHESHEGGSRAPNAQVAAAMAKLSEVVKINEELESGNAELRTQAEAVQT